MKWSTAIRLVRDASEACADMVAGARAELMGAFRVTQLWAAGDLLHSPKELEWITIALAVDLPPEDVPWWEQPDAGEDWLRMTRLDRKPVLVWWRSLHAPIWNHRIVRPLLVWDAERGLDEGAIDAIRQGHAAAAGLPEPTTPVLAQRLEAEASISLAALRQRTRQYEEKRWARGSLPRIADPLWRVADGFVDILDAQAALKRPAEPG